MFSFGESDSSYYPLSYNYHSPSFTNQEKNTFPQHHQNLVVGPYNYNHIPYKPNSPTILGNSHIANANSYVIPFHNPTNNRFSLEALSMANSSTVMDHISSKKSNVTPKKDRHTKICTAQGVRDRRVRLSIHIAREFFSLQDKLGFDKASKTLGWLLAKSRSAIDELATLKTNNKSVDGEATKEMNEKNTLNGKATSKKKKGKCKEGKMNEKEIRRAKARERARERTRMKKMMMFFNYNHQIMENFANQRVQMNPLVYQSSYGDLLSQINYQSGIKVAESVVIKSKLSGSYHEYNDHEMSSKHHQDGYNYNIFNHSLIKLASECNDEILPQCNKDIRV